ncbi:hypothetical protein HU200_026409 [Digitaria exilis]|uniref:Uncharacterized protein n=1 Tax=Digitaria exilis TaxID=1010633 RepID=A0A835BV36_9POAL|nr:hypothetical protein HU200_026409 [Digitaria exilis]CAB3464388.1 unnamed protein product [Digitaria exilis]
MAASSISCSLKPPAPVKEASARLQPSPPATTTTPWSNGLRRACVAAAACAVIATASGGEGGAAVVLPRADGVVVAVDARAAPPRWSDRRECPPWRANSLENIVPENLPRPSARRRFNSIKAPDGAPALSPEAVAPFLALHSGLDDCFSL